MLSRVQHLQPAVLSRWLKVWVELKNGNWDFIDTLSEEMTKWHSLLRLVPAVQLLHLFAGGTQILPNTVKCEVKLTFFNIFHVWVFAGEWNCLLHLQSGCNRKQKRIENLNLDLNSFSLFNAAHFGCFFLEAGGVQRLDKFLFSLCKSPHNGDCCKVLHTVKPAKAERRAQKQGSLQVSQRCCCTGSLTPGMQDE